MYKTSKKIIALFLTVIFVGICIVCIVLCASPLNKYDFDGCSVEVYNYEGTEILDILTKDQCNDFISIIENSKLGKFGSSKYLEVTGRHKGYRVNLKEGHILDISVVGQYIVIDDKGYKCDSDTISKLSFYLDEIYKKHYPVFP